MSSLICFYWEVVHKYFHNFTGPGNDPVMVLSPKWKLYRSLGKLLLGRSDNFNYYITFSPRILAHLYGQRTNNCKSFHSSTAHIYDVPIATY